MKNNKTILIQKEDIKTKSWAKAAKNQNLGKLIPVSGSPIRMPFILSKHILKNQKPDAIVFRYLNDYPSFIRSLLRTFTDLFTIHIANIFHVNIFWICHNIDKESKSNFLFLMKRRRKALLRNSKKVYVLDELLIEPASKMLDIEKEKLTAINFGLVDFSEDEKEIYIKKKTIINIKNWSDSLRSSQNTKVGLWIGTTSDKLLDGLKYIAKIVTNQQENSIKVAFVVVGPIGEWLKFSDIETYSIIYKNKMVMMVDDFVDIPSVVWPEICDFVFKPSNDFSVNFTAYNSAVANLPIIGFKGTFFGDFISHYNLGIAIDKDIFAISNEFIDKINNWDMKNNTFLMQNTWEKGAEELFREG